jgi:hypothetical protein
MLNKQKRGGSIKISIHLEQKCDRPNGAMLKVERSEGLYNFSLSRPVKILRNPKYDYLCTEQAWQPQSRFTKRNDPDSECIGRHFSQHELGEYTKDVWGCLLKKIGSHFL